MDCCRIVHEEDESRRDHLGLGHETEPGQFAPEPSRRIGLDRTRQELIQLACGNAFLTDGMYKFRLVKHLACPLARQCRYEDNRRPSHEVQVASKFLQIPCRRIGVLVGDGIPLVHHHHNATSLCLNLAGNMDILCGHTFDGIDHDDGHVGPADCTERPQDTVFLDPGFHPAPAADACRVDQHHLLVVMSDHAVNGIPGRSGNVADHSTLLAKQAVEET